MQGELRMVDAGWLKAWWDNDFSWEGLAEKRAFDPVSGEMYGSLQDFFADEVNDLIEFGGRRWTRFHLPICDLDGNPSEKHDWDEATIGALHEKIRHWMSGAEDEGKSGLYLFGIVVPGRFKSPSEIGSVNLGFSWFFGFAGFEHATFSGRANFWDATFSDTASFRDATFGGYANFWDATFSGRANFGDATFSDTASFRDATFGGYANFRDATFGGYADFWDATFGGYADFEDATFGGYADFWDATFGGTADFEDATFGGTADFEDATFSGRANFGDATFSGNAHFVRATFSGNAYFVRATFVGTANFYSATFERPVSFAGVGDSQFLGADFSNATFKHSADFSGRKFKGPASFGGAKFEHLAFFHDCRLRSDTSFLRTRFAKPPRTWAAFLKAVNDACTKLPQRTKYLPKRIEELMARGPFEPEENQDDEQDRERHETKKLPFGWFSRLAVRFPIIRGRWELTQDMYGDLVQRYETAFRTLRVLSSEVKHIQNEAMFYRLEMDARRFRTDNHWFEVFLLWAFGKSSDYGTNVFKPLGVLLLALIGFCLGWCVFAGVSVGANLGDVVPFISRQFIPPASIWSGQELSEAPVSLGASGLFGSSNRQPAHND